MANLILFILTVLIWGSTWYAIEFQLGTVAVEVSPMRSCQMATTSSSGRASMKAITSGSTISRNETNQQRW